MQVEIRELTETKAALVVSDANHAFVNALRRTLIADVPKLAIEDVVIYDNTSALFDEIISHRLGLLPIPTDLQLMQARETCTGCGGEGCPTCTVIFTLSKEGPGMVYSSDLQPADRKFAVKDERVPIVKLGENQRVMLEAHATLGTAARHAKWTPVHGAGYKEYPVVKIKGDTSETIDGRICPTDAITEEDGHITLVDAEKCTLCMNCVQVAGDAVEISSEPRKFIFRYETDGSITAKEALQHAIKTLIKRVKNVEEVATAK